MTDFAAFLLARIAEDQAAATEAAHGESGRWATGGDASTRAVEDADAYPVIYDEGSPSYAQAAHIARHDPARVLADCEAKRQVIESYRHHAGRYAEEQYLGGVHTSLRNIRDSLFWVMLRLAVTYGGHADYRDEWRP